MNFHKCDILWSTWKDIREAPVKASSGAQGEVFERNKLNKKYIWSRTQISKALRICPVKIEI